MNLPFAHKKQIALSKYTTFGIGGPALYFAEAVTIHDMQHMLQYASCNNLPVFILGKGSNVLFDDRGFNGLVILNKIDYLDGTAEGILRAGSGYSFARLGNRASRKGWSGLEFASGIPATVGGAIYMNAGSGGQQIADVLIGVSYITEKGKLVHFERNALEFGYRTSPFQQWKGAIVEGVFQVKMEQQAHAFQKKMLDYRLKTQPYKEKSAGCAFRNPDDISAGALIQQCALKGVSVGAACVSSVHANFIVNQGGATAQDVQLLMKKIKETVFEKKGILLEEEIRIISFNT